MGTGTSDTSAARPRLGWRALAAGPANLLALGFGSGLAPVAPGTWGTLAAVPLYLALAQLPLGLYLAVLACACVAGVWICGAAARNLGVADHPAIVWDEICGYLLTMTAAPSGWKWVVVGFLLFRLFDIIKPWPVRLLDRHLGGGLGVMADDLAAGALALVGLQALAWWAGSG